MATIGTFRKTGDAYAAEIITLAAPVFANLVEGEEGAGHRLIWSRSSMRRYGAQASSRTVGRTRRSAPEAKRSGP